MGRLRARSWGLGLVIGLVGLAGAVRAAPRPLGATERHAVEAVPDEKPYDVRIHFLTSNEKRHDVFFPSLRDLGGVYVGVASDQNYTLAAMAGAELMWLIDIDEQVIQWHRIYAALLLSAPAPADLAALLDGRHGGAVAAALRERWGETEGAALLKAFQRDRPRIAAHVRREIGAGLPRDGKGVSWLCDLSLYSHVRTLAQDRRIQAHVGDLHGDTTLVAIGAAARAAHLTVRVFYISNVEQWFRYSPQLIRNLAGLPRDGRSVILRTLARHELRAPVGDRWHFSVETLDDFVRSLTAPEPLRRVQDLMPEMARADRAGQTVGLSLLGSLQPPVPAAGIAQAPRPAPLRVTPPMRAPEPKRPLLAARTRPQRPSWAWVVVPF